MTLTSDELRKLAERPVFEFKTDNNVTMKDFGREHHDPHYPR